MAKMDDKDRESIAAMAQAQVVILISLGGGILDPLPNGEAWRAYGAAGRPLEDGLACTFYEEAWAAAVSAHNREYRAGRRKWARAHKVSYAFVAEGWLADPLRATFSNRHEAVRAWNKYGARLGTHSTVRLLRYRTDVEAMKGGITDRPGKNGCLEILSTM